MKEITVKVSVEIPQVPTFLRTGDDTPPFDVADVSDDGLRQIATEWTEALIAHAKQRRAHRRLLAAP